MTDERLAEQAQWGSGAAFAALVERHRQGVYRIARSMCATARDTEEVVLGTFLSAYREAASRPTGSFKTWLYGIALKATMERRPVRRSAAMERFLPRFDERGRLAGRAGEWPERSRAQVSGFLREAFDCLDDGVRAAFVLRDLVDLPAEEAAAVLQESPEVVRDRVHRARLVLRGFLDRLWADSTART
jgi:RNA polymerase sigma-70 factor (ECF subfamily)